MSIGFIANKLAAVDDALDLIAIGDSCGPVHGDWSRHAFEERVRTDGTGACHVAEPVQPTCANAGSSNDGRNRSSLMVQPFTSPEVSRAELVGDHAAAAKRTRRGRQSGRAKAGAAVPKPAGVSKSIWRPPTFRVAGDPDRYDLSRSATDALVRTSCGSAPSDPPPHNGVGTGPLPETGRLDDDRGGREDVRQRFVAALASWRAYHDFLDWLGSGEDVPRCRVGSTPQVRELDLEEAEYFER